MSDAYDFDKVMQRSAVANRAQGADVAPEAAVSALATAPVTQVPADTGMHDHAPLAAQAQTANDNATLATSPSVRSFVASSPAKAAAVSDDYGPLAAVAQQANSYVATAMTDFFHPMAASARQFVTDVGRLYHTEEGTSPLALIPGFDPQTRKLGSVLADAFGATIGGLFGGTANVVARPLSYVPQFTVGPGGRLVPVPRAAAQANVANAINTALMAGRPGVHPALRPPPDIYEGNVTPGPKLLSGPTEPIADAEFTDIAPPGVNPAHTPTYDAVAQMDAEQATRVQDALAATATHSRAPTLATDFLANHTAIGDSTVSVPAESIAKLWADGHEVFADQAAAVQEALTTGADVTLPAAEYHTAVAGKPFAEELNNVTRFREGGASVEEAKALPIDGEEGAGEGAAPRAPRTFTPPEGVTAESVAPIAARADDAVAQVFKEHALSALFTDAKAAGLTEPQFAKYSGAIEEAQAALHDKLLQRTYGQLRRELTPEWKAAVGARATELEAEISKLPSVQAMHVLSQSGYKLDRDLVTNFYPEPASRLPNSVVKANGNHPDAVADFAGYGSGAEMVSELADLQSAIEASGAKNLKDYIKRQARDAAESEERAKNEYDVTPEGLLHLAREAMVAPEIGDVLTKDLSALASAHGLPFDKASVKAFAAEEFGKLTVAEGVKPRTFAENMRRLGNKAEAALLDNKPVEAFKYKQQQLIQYHHLAEAFKFAKEFARADKAMRQVARKPIVRSMDQAARNQLRNIVAQLGYRVRSGKFENYQSALKGKTLEEYGRALMARGQPAYMTDVPKVGEGGIVGLPVDAFRDVAAMFNSIGTLGREEMTAEVAGQKIALKALEAQVRENATAIGRPYTAGEAQRAKGAVHPLDLYKPSEILHLMNKIAATGGHAQRSVGAATTRSEVPLFWLDRERNGPLMQSIVNPLNDGTYYKAEKIKAFSDAMRTFLKTQPKGWEKSLNTRVNVPELTYGRDARGKPVQWMRDRGNLIMAALHTGTEDNFANLLEGFGWDADVVTQVLHDKLSAADWRYVQHLWDQMHSTWPDVQRLYRDTVGLAPKEIEGRSVTTPQGTLTGRYWPLDYDWSAVGEQADGEGGTVEVHDPMALGEGDLFPKTFRVSTPPNGSTKQRTQFRGPLNLDHGTMHRRLEEVFHDLAFRKPLIQAAKVLRQPGVRLAIREALGPEYLERTEQWLKQIAGQSVYDQTALKGLAGLFTGLRHRFTVFQIGYNVLTLAKHGGIAASHMTGEGGTRLMGAAADLMSNRDYWTKFIDDNSGEVRNTLMSLDRDTREVMERQFRKTGALSGFIYHSTTMFAVVKRVEAQATWLAKYREVHEGGASHDDAVALANKAVRDTQGSGTITNLNAVQAPDPSLGGAVLKLFNIFASFENTTTNRVWTINRRQQRINETVKRSLGRPNGRGFDGFEDEGLAGARRDQLHNLAQLLAFVVIPPLFLTALDEVTGKHGQKFGERLLAHSMQGLLGGTIPGGNELAQLPHTIATKGRDTGGDAPLQSMMKSFSAAGVDAWDTLNGRPVTDARWVSHAIETAGYTLGLPLKPAERAGQFAYDKSHGLTPPGLWNDFIGTLAGPAAVKDTGATTQPRHHK